MSSDLSTDLVALPLNTRARQAIRAEMARRGINQADLAHALGRGQAWISWRLTGKTSLALADVEAIARVLVVSVETLLDLPSVPKQRRAS